jgi:hypothetical protein
MMSLYYGTVNQELSTTLLTIFNLSRESSRFAQLHCQQELTQTPTQGGELVLLKNSIEDFEIIHKFLDLVWQNAIDPMIVM